MCVCVVSPLVSAFLSHCIQRQYVKVNTQWYFGLGVHEADVTFFGSVISSEFSRLSIVKLYRRSGPWW